MSLLQEISPAPPPPVEARRRLEKLLDRREERERSAARMAGELASLESYLSIAVEVTSALEQLGEELFQQLLRVVEEKISIALEEILDQPIRFQARADFKRGAATVEFSIARDGHEEDVLRGQGGSVANVISVGLRIFALTTLDEARHRRFLVLDEQDCWLRPDLVPKLVKMVHDAGRALGFQILMISHHDISVFERYADRLYQLTPNRDGSVSARLVSAAAPEADSGSQAPQLS